MIKPSKLSNKDLLNEILSLYSKDENYERYFSANEPDLFNDDGVEYARILREEILSRMIDSNSERFDLFGVIDKSTGKLVSDITNPRHKYWESEKRAQSAINGYNPLYVTQRDRKKHNKEDLEVVNINCIVKGD